MNKRADETVTQKQPPTEGNDYTGKFATIFYNTAYRVGQKVVAYFGTGIVGIPYLVMGN